MFQNPSIGGIGLGSGTRNRRRTRDSGGSTIVAITDKQTKSLLRERDSKIAALEKEVLGLQNKISTLSKEQMIAGGQRKGKKGLTPYGNTVRVSTSKCNAQRRQVWYPLVFSDPLEIRRWATLIILSYRIFELCTIPFSFCQNALGWAGTRRSPPKPFSTLSPATRTLPRSRWSIESKPCSAGKRSLMISRFEHFIPTRKGNCKAAIRNSVH